MYFEYLLLKADILDIPKTVLEETYNYADSKKYMSWEEYYTDYERGFLIMASLKDI